MATAAHAIEQPRYQVLQSDGAFELRQYEPMLVAHVEVEGDASGARNAGFRLLAGLRPSVYQMLIQMHIECIGLRLAVINLSRC